MCLRQEVPETATFLSLDTSLNVTAMTYVSLFLLAFLKIQIEPFEAGVPSKRNHSFYLH